MSSPRGGEAVAVPVAPAEEGWRLDRFLHSRWPDLTRSALQRALAEPGLQVLVDGRPGRPGQRLRTGQLVALPAHPLVMPAYDPRAPLQPLALQLVVAWEDEHLVVVDKPAGLVVHPGPGHLRDTLVNALVARGQALSTGYDDEEEPVHRTSPADRPGIVHRLDKDTSGLMVVAKTSLGHRAIARQLLRRTLSRRYLALVRGVIAEPEGIITAAIGRDRHRQRMAAVPTGEGREAETHFRVLERFERATLVEATLRSGRTHQVRVHLSHISHPVVGDALYGGAGKLATRLGLSRQALHAWRIRFQHPVDGRWLEFSSEPPADIQSALAALRGG